MRTIDLIITDIGGTLVRTDGAIMAAVRRAAEELGIPGGHEDPVYDVFGTSIREYVHAYLPDEDKGRTGEVHERFWALFPHAVLDQIKPFDGVEAALTELNGRGVRLVAHIANEEALMSVEAGQGAGGHELDLATTADADSLGQKAALDESVEVRACDAEPYGGFLGGEQFLVGVEHVCRILETVPRGLSWGARET